MENTAVNHPWPDELAAPDPQAIQKRLLEGFWHEIRQLPDLIHRQEFLLAAACVGALRDRVLDMMLALNGIGRPHQTRHLNAYLSPSQRQAIQKTLILPDLDAEAWIGQAVALVVIFRWYAPQLVDRYSLRYPNWLEESVWAELRNGIATWPATVTSN